ncbi:hypothetical protein JJQ59_36405 (plasmid) [Cupriavidus necator]|uniref:Uncharacterized protein n=1 Tax=Cupriavidus necator TaxID=106590 RepID=A0A367PF44_CUPNE|nr:hypothetical protein [Cupriavidus necator]QQX89996.1 hypothetical protein JJQ59_36405 [Cupriavidus necator]RCJ06500.1 hypothetical protein DDK22_21030 [Cupriavidus necator]
MAKMTPQEPQSAAEYDDRTTAAVKSVLIEIGQILGSFKGKFAIIGGAVPWLLLRTRSSYGPAAAQWLLRDREQEFAI